MQASDGLSIYPALLAVTIMVDTIQDRNEQEGSNESRNDIHSEIEISANFRDHEPYK